MPDRFETHRFEHSPFLESVTCIQFDSGGHLPMHPDGCWDFAFLKQQGRTLALRTGLTTKTVTLSYEAGDEVLAISFKPSAFMPLMPSMRMLDEAAMLELAAPWSFRLAGDAFEIPTFGNADAFAERLIRAGLVLSNETVASVIEGEPRAMSERTLQRHFQATTGMTFKHFTMIQRARKAVTLLRSGRSALDVAFALGFSDQAHLINSLRQIMGQTPGQIQSLPTG